MYIQQTSRHADFSLYQSTRGFMASIAHYFSVFNRCTGLTQSSTCLYLDIVMQAGQTDVKVGTCKSKHYDVLFCWIGSIDSNCSVTISLTMIVAVHHEAPRERLSWGSAAIRIHMGTASNHLFAGRSTMEMVMLVSPVINEKVFTIATALIHLAWMTNVVGQHVN